MLKIKQRQWTSSLLRLTISGLTNGKHSHMQNECRLNDLATDNSPKYESARHDREEMILRWQWLELLEQALFSVTLLLHKCVIIIIVSLSLTRQYWRCGIDQCFSTSMPLLLWEMVRCAVENYSISRNWSKNIDHFQDISTVFIQTGQVSQLSR